ncbi:mitotic spindle positioning protein meduse [Rhynchophorus ferrugineus]|uniref:Uncharacterized protein n=1 Tax=Rhynchophorus ferrugineus TaxID=354439 RepID=A0A834MN91_RHYFE|nr:hypothetical protein GWI33_011107 [Rhynchophorus ferrugineus]
MSTSNLSTLDRIQLEIKECIEREKELKNGYSKVPSENTNDNLSQTSNISLSRSNTNGLRKFIQNTTSKGVMHKFLKSRGKLNVAPINATTNKSNWTSDAAFTPAKITIEKGSKLPRNGFVSAEEKMKKELQDFQQREAQLREERRKSQPNLMAALQSEEEREFENSDFYYNGNLKAAKSMANLYNNSDDGFEDTNSSTGGSLKPARSLAELCDVSDDDSGIPGTHSLIMQFENMQFKNKSSSPTLFKDF